MAFSLETIGCHKTTSDTIRHHRASSLDLSSCTWSPLHNCTVEYENTELGLHFSGNLGSQDEEVIGEVNLPKVLS